MSYISVSLILFDFRSWAKYLIPIKITQSYGARMKNLLTVFMFTFLTLTAQAEVRSLPFTQTTIEGLDDSKTYDEDYFTISEITVTDVEISNDLVWAPQYLGFDKNLGQVIMVVDKLIALGKKIWPIIEAGKPVVNVNIGAPISVLPRSEDGDAIAFYNMDSWNMPMAKTYKVEYKNGFGMNVIAFDYTVNFQYGGKYQGAGAYITGLNVQASNTTVSWGFDFDAKSQLMSIVNHGSLEEPVAGATIRIDYTAKSILRQISTSESFHVNGLGKIQPLR
jgi:hypothetical protein